ncbi:MAG: hypothetical protein ACKVJK_22375 [Methylophagaceae bacterium]
MKIYKTVFDTEAQGKDVLIQKDVWKEVTDEEGVTSMQYINGTKGVVYIGKVVKTPGTYDPDGKEITPPIYYPGVAYDIMSTDDLDFGDNEVYPGDLAAHQFYGFARGAEVPPVLSIEEKE